MTYPALTAINKYLSIRGFSYNTKDNYTLLVNTYNNNLIIKKVFDFSEIEEIIINKEYKNTHKMIERIINIMNKYEFMNLDLIYEKEEIKIKIVIKKMNEEYFNIKIISNFGKKTYKSIEVFNYINYDMIIKLIKYGFFAYIDTEIIKLIY